MANALVLVHLGLLEPSCAYFFSLVFPPKFASTGAQCVWALVLLLFFPLMLGMGIYRSPGTSQVAFSTELQMKGQKGPDREDVLAYNLNIVILAVLATYFQQQHKHKCVLTW